MRNPYRIKRILNKIEMVWSARASIPLLPILVDMVDYSPTIGGYANSDEELEDKLDAYIKEHGLESGWKS